MKLTMPCIWSGFFCNFGTPQQRQEVASRIYNKRRAHMTVGDVDRIMGAMTPLERKMLSQWESEHPVPRWGPDWARWPETDFE